jgi:hypothetical protein
MQSHPVRFEMGGEPVAVAREQLELKLLGGEAMHRQGRVGQ